MLLGAGYDTRAYGPLVRDGVACFELDQPSTQVLKRSSLREAGIEVSHVTFVPVDFSRDDAFAKLIAQGYDPGRKTVFLWGGGDALPGRGRRADVYGERMLRLGRGRLTKKVLDSTSEGFGFGLSFETDWEQNLRDFLASESLTLGESYFMGRAHAEGPFIVVAECIV